MGDARPEDNRFTPVVVIPGGELSEPMVFQVLADERVLLVERKGALKLYDPADGTVSVVAEIPVNTVYNNSRTGEEGLIGLTLDPNFEENGWIYMIYADPDVPRHALARWTFDGQSLVEGSKHILLEWPHQREQCCHTGGGMTWDSDGNLYLTIGNNTRNSTGAQTDERPGREPWDDQRGAANTNDLRGKILRIHPEPDGTYSIPDGNLFRPATPNTRPEIYTMGNRNPWRPFIDSATGYLYWGEVGPDAREDSEIGPMGYDEFNQARGPGFFGWPYFVGDNQAFPYYDYAHDRPLREKDPAQPTNTSANNTGREVLPPAHPAFIYYPYQASEDFPLVGVGGRSANGGPIYRRDDFDDPERPFPPYYEGKWFISDFSRGWIMVVTMDGNSDYVSMERFLPDYHPVEPIDNKFGPNGDFYVLEYGSTWYDQAPDAKLVRIEYNGGNRAPAPALVANPIGGAVPVTVELSAEGTVDYDGDALTYEWVVGSDGTDAQTFSGPEATVTLDTPGSYAATLTVTDEAGGSTSTAVTLVAGNEPPVVEVLLDVPNRTFFFPGTPIPYEARITDAEDAAIEPSRVAFNVEYVPDGLELRGVMASLEGSANAARRFRVGSTLMARSDCATCHTYDVRSAGPSFLEISDRYRDDPGAIDALAAKVLEGGSGVWDTEVVMPAHPTFSDFEARALVRYMIGSHDRDVRPRVGTYEPEVPDGDPGTGRLLFHATYMDGGVRDIPSLTAAAEATLRSPHVSIASADETSDMVTRVQDRGAGSLQALPTSGDYLGYHGIDLTGVKAIEVDASASSSDNLPGGTVEVHLDAPTGPLLGQAEIVVPIVGAGGGRGRGQGGPPDVLVTFEPIDEVRDVYFVFTNTEAPADRPLATVTEMIFMRD